MRKITINGKNYDAKPFSFNLICDLEDLGIAMSALGRKPMVTLRAYVALCMGVDLEDAGKEIEKHLASGGNFEDAIKVMSEEMEDSDFFRTLSQTENEEVTES